MTEIGRAELKLTIDDKEYKLALDGVGKDADKTADRIKGISQAIDLKVFTEFASKAGDALKFVVGGIIDLGSRGADVADVSGAFADLSARAGETAQTMLGALHEGTAGTISDFELMQLANKTLGTGLVTSADQMRTLAAGAKLLGDRTGTDAKEAYEKLTKAIASGKDAQLKQLGLFVDNKKATEAFAAAHHKTAGELTDTERAQAIANATLEALKGQLQAAGPPTLDFADRVAQAKVALENMKDQVAVGVAQSPVFAAALGAVSESMSAAFGPNQQGLVKTIVGIIENVAIGLTYVGQIGTTLASVLVSAFYAIKTVIAGDIMVVSALAETLIAFVNGLVQMGTHIPLIGEKLKGFAAGAQSLRDSMWGATQSLADETKEAMAGVAGHSALHQTIDKVAGTLVNMRDRMYEAKDATVATAAAVQPAAATFDKGNTEMSESARKAAERVKDIIEKLSGEIALGTKVGLDKRLQEIQNAHDQELAKYDDLKRTAPEKFEEIRLLVAQKYQQMADSARLGSDEIRDRTVQLQQEILLAQQTGTQQQLTELEFKKQKELEAIEFLKANYNTAYTTIAGLITQKYAQLTAAAKGHFATVEQAAAAAGFKTRAELEAQAAKAKETYQRMLDSGKFTEEELRKAHEASGAAQAAVDGTVYQNKTQLQDTLLSSASGVLRSLFGKSKGAAIAAALIDTYAAVAKAMSAYPWPWNLAPAAAALAAGMAQVSQIRKQEPQGFEVGTPGLDFANFGTASLTVLHNREAVVPQGSGHLLAGEIARAMPRGGEELGPRLDALLGAIADQPKAFARAMRLAMVMSN